MESNQLLNEMDIFKNKINQGDKKMENNTQNINTDLVEVFFARANKDIILPSKTNENAGYDIYAYFKEESMTINPFQTKLIPTGVYSCCSDDYVFIGKERGSTGTIGMRLGAGVIDSGYRGEIFISITNDNEIPIVIHKSVSKTIKLNEYILYPYSKAVAQLILLPVPKTKVTELSVDQLKSIPSNRGDGKLGSSSK